MGEITHDDRRFMLRAVELAQNARPSPNPRVGSVIVRGAEIVGEGFHRVVGTDHAEIVALRAAGERAKGATAYVTLEPCNHFGHTPPCTEALVTAGVARVVVGVRDPNPRVAGGGVERLRAAGIEVDVGAEAEACTAVIHAWAKHVREGRPYVILKVGMSLDGRIATRLGESRWITGEGARLDAHRLRAHADAVLVGVGTVLADDPLLTPRGVPLHAAPPLRVVLDTELRTPRRAAIVRTAREAPTLLVHADDVPAASCDPFHQAGVETCAVPRHASGVSLRDALRALGERGIVELLVEGGSTVHGSMLDERCVDAVICYVAPMLLGGRGALAAFGGVGAGRLADATRLGPWSIEQLGDDLKLRAEVR